MNAEVNKPHILANGPYQRPPTWIPDLRVHFSRSDGWQVTIVSARAQEWLRNALERALYDQVRTMEAETVVRTDLAGVNDLVRRARSEGYVSEYVGPHETVRL